MGTVNRDEVVALETGGTAKLRKWSVAKFLFALKLLGEAGNDVAQKISVKIVKETDPKTGVSADRMVIDWNAKDLIPLLLTIGDQFQVKITRLIKESLTDDISEDAILEWSPEDYLLVLTKILELNLSERLSKNLANLRNAFTRSMRQAPSA